MNQRSSLRRKDLLYPDLSYKIVGCAFDVHNSLGGGHHEKHYQRGLAEAFSHQGLVFQQQIGFPLHFKGKVIGKNVLDFLVEKKVVVEIKKGERFSKAHIDQVVSYLKSSKVPLALLINFASQGVMFRRIVNLKNS
ncbi:MAG: GxxExxY protein [Parcubacteria group bacterium]|nr:GxxExxY protein [Parcubacteria group bacterium]MBI2175592.1 GxxExxY protein [Parcubacteria group bacterium]